MREKLAIKSSVIGLSAKLLGIVMSFVSTRFFVQYLGVEILGVNGVFSNVLGFLQLAELGIGAAITYALYQPIVDNNIKEIQILMHFYKIVYRWICIIILAAGVVLTPFLYYFVTDTSYALPYLILVYFIQLASSASTYLLAYKRNLLYVDQKQYISTIIDAIVNICCCAIRILVIVFTKSYIGYLLILIIQNVGSNLIIHLWCNKEYPYLKEKVNERYDKIDRLRANVKNLMIGRIGGWVYSSTDHLIISRFVGVVTVGVMSNYYTLRTTLSTIASSIVAPIQPMMGNYIRECKDTKKTFDLFLTYSFIRFCIADVITVGFIVMGNSVVKVWLGEKYLVSQFIVVLLAADIFISITHGPTGEFVQVLGLFHDDRNMSIIGVLINLGTSLLLVRPLGAAGVLMGTVITQFYYWFARAKIVFKSYFQGGVFKYLFKIAKYILITIAEVFIIEKLFTLPLLSGCSFSWVIVKCIICVLVCGIVLLTTNFYTDEFNNTVGMLKRYMSSLMQNRRGNKE